MDLKLIRRLLREGSSIVLLEEGHPPLVVRQLRTEEPPEDVPIASRWPKGLALGRRQNEKKRSSEERQKGTERSVFDGRRPSPAPEQRTTVDRAPAGDSKQEQILERLNKEILALKEQIAQEEAEGSNH